MDASLRSVCGSPSGLVPARGTTAWTEAESALTKRLKRAGVKCRFRSWAVLWNTLHDTPPPLAAQWEDLLGDHTHRHLG